MPLDKSCSTNAMGKNISQMVKGENKPQDQAVAIAYNVLKKACGVKDDKQMTPSEIVAQGKGESVRVRFGSEVLSESIKWDSSWKKWEREHRDMAKAIGKDLEKAIRASMGSRTVKVDDVLHEFPEFLDFSVGANFEREIEKRMYEFTRDDYPDVTTEEKAYRVAYQEISDEVSSEFSKAGGRGLRVDDIDPDSEENEIVLWVRAVLSHYGWKPQNESKAVVQFGRITRRK